MCVGKLAWGTGKLHSLFGTIRNVDLSITMCVTVLAAQGGLHRPQCLILPVPSLQHEQVGSFMMPGLFHEESPFENKSFFPDPHHMVAFRQPYLVVEPVTATDYDLGPLFYLRSHHVFTHCLL